MKATGLYTSAVLVLVWVFVTGAAAQQTEDLSKALSEFNNGTIKGSAYENTMLGLRIRFPKSMTVDSKADAEGDIKKGIELLNQGTKEDETRIAEMLRKERIIFAIRIPATEVSAGASLNLTIKKDDNNADVWKSAEKTIEYFTQSGKMKLEKPASTEKHGGLELVTFTLSMDYQNTRIFSRNYSTKRNGYLLTFGISYVDSNEFTKMESVLKGIETF